MKCQWIEKYGKITCHLPRKKGSYYCPKHTSVWDYHMAEEAEKWCPARPPVRPRTYSGPGVSFSFRGLKGSTPRPR